MPNALPRLPLTKPSYLLVIVAVIVIPALSAALLVNPDNLPPIALIGGPAMAVGLMAAGMIGAAAAQRFWIGILLAFVAGTALIALGYVLGLPIAPNPFSMMVTIAVASLSFAARGALFARSALDRGWWIAVFVVAGEGAIVLTALAEPEMLPDWLLALLPAQWANIAIQVALMGIGTGAQLASSALIALAGTAAATLLVARLWPRRWPYLIMFTAWLGLSALVYHYPDLPDTSPDRAQILSANHEHSILSAI